jgi:hypothetical protein
VPNGVTMADGSQDLCYKHTGLRCFCRVCFPQPPLGLGFKASRLDW